MVTLETGRGTKDKGEWKKGAREWCKGRSKIGWADRNRYLLIAEFVNAFEGTKGCDTVGTMLHRLCVVARPSCRPLAPLDRVPGPPCSACPALRRPRIKVATSGPVVMVNSYLYECFEQASVSGPLLPVFDENELLSHHLVPRKGDR